MESLCFFGFLASKLISAVRLLLCCFPDQIHKAQSPALGVDEFGHERVGWSFAQITDGAVLHDLPCIHEDDFVTEINGFRQIVSDKQHGLAQTHENFLQIFLQRGPH